MKKHSDARIGWRVLVISLVVLLALPCTAMGGPSDEEYDPPTGRGPLVILLSGYDGSDCSRGYAATVAKLGYYVVLIDSSYFDKYEFIKSGTDGLRRIIEQLRSSPKALPGRALVIGFSMGGGIALTYAAGMPDLVSAIVAYYPKTNQIMDMNTFVSGFKLPILVLAGEKDRFFDCCLIESMRDMEAVAKKRGGAPFELVVYPIAGHGFNSTCYSTYRAEDSDDAWQRTKKMLSQYQPLR
jgi:dienelactone hydrolase